MKTTLYMCLVMRIDSNFRKTINDGECILPNSDSLKRSGFDAGKNITFFAHGYLGASWNWYMHEMKNAMLAKVRYNITYIRLIYVPL